jgi:hypothetical protein
LHCLLCCPLFVSYCFLVFRRFLCLGFFLTRCNFFGLKVTLHSCLVLYSGFCSSTVHKLLCNCLMPGNISLLSSSPLRSIGFVCYFRFTVWVPDIGLFRSWYALLLFTFMLR